MSLLRLFLALLQPVILLGDDPRSGTFSFRQKYDAPDGLRYTLEGSGVFKIDGATWGPDRVTILTPAPSLPWCLTSEPIDASSSVGGSKKLVRILRAEQCFQAC